MALSDGSGGGIKHFCTPGTECFCVYEALSQPMPGDVAEMAREFNEHPNSSGKEHTRALTWTLAREESKELIYELAMAADGNPNHEQIARELADVVYVAYTTAWAFDIDLNAALAEIHRAAMDKMEANVRRPDGKIIKHPGFVPPDMTEAVRDAR